MQMYCTHTHAHTHARVLRTAGLRGWRTVLLGCMRVLNPAQCESQCAAVRSVNPLHTSAQTVSGSAQLRSIYSLLDVRRGRRGASLSNSEAQIMETKKTQQCGLEGSNTDHWMKGKPDGNGCSCYIYILPVFQTRTPEGQPHRENATE